MRKALFYLLIFACFSIVFAAPEVTISSITLSDSTINTGESAGITFTVTNTGDRDLTSIGIVLNSDLNLARTTFSFDDIEIGESRQISTSFSAPVGLSSGTYSISISVSFNIGDQKYSNQAGALVNVLSTNYLVVSSYTSNLVIDDYTSFNLNVTNQGNTDLNNLLVDLILPDGFVPTPGSQFYINSLSVGESKLLTTNVFIERGIEPDSYQFTISKSAEGYIDSDTLNVIVTGTPVLSFSGVNLDPEIPVSGTAQTISVQFENIGSGKAYNVVAKLLLEQDVVGVTTEYLGTLDRDDLTSAIFDIQTPLTKSLKGAVTITYNDASGVSNSITQDLNFDVVQAESISVTTLLIVGAVIAVIAYLAYKRFYKKKK
ncbi:MAG: hypothetical protein JW791_00840 [Nanoarchaeota archaeon]|nr:hypothetical protein [Nanoarchaeota archaeon]